MTDVMTSQPGRERRRLVSIILRKKPFLSKRNMAVQPGLAKLQLNETIA